MSHILLDRRIVILVLSFLLVPMLESSSMAQWTPQASEPRRGSVGLTW